MMPPTCPTCARPGRHISAVTFESHVLAAWERAPGGGGAQGWFMCRSAACPTIYFRGDETLGAAALDALPFHKNGDDPAQLVCFCFHHTVGAIRADARAHGASTIRARVQAACARGEDDCERTNPQGRCCLGNVGAVASEALRAAGAVPARADGGSGCGCEGTEAAAPPERPADGPPTVASRGDSPFIILPAATPSGGGGGCGCGCAEEAD